MQLRPYQSHGINLLRARFKAGDTRILFWLATGGGKSIVFSQLINNMAGNGFRILVIVRRRELIFQAKKHLTRRGLSVSVIMGTEKGFDPHEQIQVSSIDTLIRRIDNVEYDFLKKFDAVIVDEAHDTTADKYRQVLDSIAFKVCVGFTATPFRIGNRVHDWWQSCVKPIALHELRDQGFLTRADVYIPSKIDVSGIKKVNGDFQQKALFERASEMKVVGDIVENYKKYGQGKTAILFAVNILHSKLMAQAFNEAGIPAEHCDQSTKRDEREIALGKLAKGQIKVLCNVNIFSTGVDIPSVEVGIMARPTMSEALYIQQVGRILRPFKRCVCGKTFGAEEVCHEPIFIKDRAIILDHANNTSRHGLPFKERHAELDEKDKTRKDSFLSEAIKTCDACWAAYQGKNCPYCAGDKKEEKNREVKTEDGELVKVDERQLIFEDMTKDWQRWLMRERQYRAPSKQKFFMLHKKYGDAAFEFMTFPDWIKKELVINEFLQTSSRIIEERHGGNAKVFS